jgi:hypothetical protein
MQLLLVIGLFLGVPALIMAPYLVAASRFYRIVGNQGWKQPEISHPTGWIGSTMRDRVRVWSKAELGDFGPEAAAALQSMRRRQVVGFIAVIGYWVFLAAWTSR